MDRLQILTLLLTPGIGPKTVRRVLETHPPTNADISELLMVLEQVRQQYPRLSIPTRSTLDIAHAKGAQILEKCRALGIETIGWDDDLYPSRLRSIADPPVLLYILGAPSALVQKLAIAVVGTREPSEYGAVVAERFGQVFAKSGAAVVSGLALGCDSAAHKGCLMENGITVAVLAHGLDSVYPKQNVDLAARILSKSGALVSEYAPGTNPQSRYFVERDRLQSGFSDAVVIVETDLKGGTMHTARFCREQGRVLAAFLHPCEKRNVKSRGNEILIQERNAYPLKNEHDITMFLELLLNRQRQDRTQAADQFTEDTISSGQLSLF